MAVTRIKNNQITDNTILANAKLADYTITSTKIANNLTYGSDLTVSGNLTVTGNVTAIDTTDLVVEDPLFLLAKDQTGAPSLDIGFIGKRGTEDNIAFIWDESADQFVAVFTTSEVTNTTISISSYASLQVLDLTVSNLDVNGNVTFSGSIVGDVTVTGNVDANNFNATNDITAGGVVDATGNVTGGNLVTAGDVTTATVTASGNVDGGNITTGGVVDATGNVSGGNLVTAGDVTTATVTASGNVSGGNLVTAGDVTTATVTASGNVDGGNITTAGVVEATGNVSGGNLTTVGNVDGANANFTGDVSAANISITGTFSAAELNATGNVTGNNLVSNNDVTTATVTASGNIDGGNITTGGVVDATGNVTGGNIVTGGVVDATGNVTGGNLVTAGDVTTDTVTASGAITATGNVSGGNIVTAGLVSSGTLETAGNALIGGNLIVQGNITYINIDDLRVEDPIIILGTGPNGQPLSADDGKDRGIYMEYYTTGLGNAFMGWQNSSGNLVIANDVSFAGNDVVAINSFGNLNVGNLFPESINLEQGNLVAGNLISLGVVDATGNVSGGNLVTAGVVDATGNVTGGNLVTAGDVTTATVTASGNIDGGNLVTAGVVDATGNVTGGNLVTAGDVTTATVTASGNIDGGNITTAGVVEATGNVTGGNLVTAGDVTTATVTASSTIDATGNITGGNLVTAGDVTTATVTASGNIDGGNLVTGGVVDATGNVSGGNITTAGVVDATGNVTGGNITTAGDVTTATVTASGNISAGNIAVTGIADLGNIRIEGDDITNKEGNDITFNAAGADINIIAAGTNNANLFVVDAGSDTVIIGSGTPTTEASLKIGTSDSILIPVGNSAQRPSSPVTGMIRFNTTIDNLEFYDADGWATAGTDFTVITADSFNGDGSTVQFTLSEDSTTAGTIVSINGVVQIPTTAYAVSGNVLTFTEAPEATDVIDTRVLTTTQSIGSLQNAQGTALFEGVDGSAAFSTTGNILPSANVTYNLGSDTLRWNDLFLAGSTLTLGNIQIKNTVGNTIGFFGADGTTPAGIDTQNIDSAAISNGTSNVSVISSGGNVDVSVGGSGIVTFHAGGIDNGQANGVGNIGTASSYFNTVFAKATSAQYADLAEMYTADADIAPGTVVMFGGEAEVTECDTAGCHRVAGVVSTNPSYLMNSACEGEHVVAVALVGRVPCRVVGTVAKGDLMVSAGNGAAQANNDARVGTVIGKALEDFDGVEGVIEVVVGRF